MSRIAAEQATGMTGQEPCLQHNIHQPHGAQQHGGERWHDMMPAEERHSQRRPAQRSAARGPEPRTTRAKNRRTSGTQIELIRICGQSVCPTNPASAKTSRRTGMPYSGPQIAAQRITEHPAQPVNQHPIPVERADRYMPIAQRHGEEHPVQRIGDARLHLANQRMAAPLVGVPQRKSPGVKLARLEIQPGTDHVGQVRTLQESPLPRNREFPVEPRRQQQQHQQRARRAPTRSHAANPASPVRGAAKTGGSRPAPPGTSTRKS